MIRRRPQRGGGTIYINPRQTPEITSPVTMRDKMNFFLIACHGDTSLQQYFVVPPRTIVLFIGESAEVSGAWPGERAWLFPNDDDWEMIYNTIYGIEGDYQLEELTSYFRGRADRQLYMPGDLLPDTRCSFKTTPIASFPCGIFELPLTLEGDRDRFLNDLWGGATREEAFLPTWAVLYLARHDLIYEEFYRIAQFKSPAVEQEWRAAVRGGPAPTRHPLSYFFNNPRVLLDIYDAIVQGHPSNLLSQHTLEGSQRAVPFSTLLRTRSTAPKDYTFIIATMCRVTYDFYTASPRNYPQQPSYQLARRMSVSINREQCALSGTHVFSILPVWIAWRNARAVAGEVERFRGPHKKILLFLKASLQGYPIPADIFAEFLDIAALPVQEDLPADSPARALQESFRAAFAPLRRALRNLPGPAEGSVGARVRAISQVAGPLSEARTHISAAAADIERAEAEAERVRLTAELQEYIDTLDAKLADFPPLLAEVQEGDPSEEELVALEGRADEIRQHVVNISTISRGMSAAHYAIVEPRITALEHSLREFKIISDFQHDYHTRERLQPEFDELTAIRDRIDRAFIAARTAPPLAQPQALQALLGEAHEKEEELTLARQREPESREATILLNEFYSTVLPSIRAVKVYHDRLVTMTNLNFTISQTSLLLQIVGGLRANRIFVPALLPSLESMRVTLSQMNSTMEQTPAFQAAEKYTTTVQLARLQISLADEIRAMRGAGGRRRRSRRQHRH